MTKPKLEDFTPVESSNIASVLYVQGEGLYVHFKTGATYNYPQVKKELYKQLLEAESKGKFFNANVKGQYEYVLLGQ